MKYSGTAVPASLDNLATKNPLADLLTLSLLALPVGAQQVLVVDEAGAPGSFPDLQAAVDAAVDGDVLLVRPGTYSGFEIDGLSFTVVGDGPGVIVEEKPAGLFVGDTLVVRDLASGRRANIAGLDLEIEVPIFGVVFPPAGILVEDCAGSVLITNCTSPDYS